MLLSINTLSHALRTSKKLIQASLFFTFWSLITTCWSGTEVKSAPAGGASAESSGNSSWKRKDSLAKAELRETPPTVSLNPNIPLQTQLLIWTGLELQSKNWEDFLSSAQRELENLKKQQEAEARKKSEQEAAARDLLRGI